MLKRKLLRDIRSNWGGYLACVSVIILGLMMYVSFDLTVESLVENQAKFYRDYNFADGFARINRAPSFVVDELRKIAGITEVDGRIVENILVNKPPEEQTTTLRLISFNLKKQSLNRFRLEEGKLPTEGERQLLLSTAFFKGNDYKIGDKIPLIISGKEIKFTITGIAASPEYVFEYPRSLLTPDSKVFGVAYVPYSTIDSLFDMDDQVNDLCFGLDSGTDYSRVEGSVTKILDKYGITEIYSRKNQLSHSVLEQEINRMKSYVHTVPAIFLTLASGILYFMLRRMVEQQRGQLGLVKAFGFTDREIIMHYISYAVLIGFVGGIIGGIYGSGISYWIAEEYKKYCYIPGLGGKFSPTLWITGIISALIFSLYAGYTGSHGLLALSPAEAMRPPVPKIIKRTPVERIGVLWKLLNNQMRMAVRNIFRASQQSVLSIAAVAISFSMMVATGSGFDSIYHSIDFQYDLVYRYDLKVDMPNFRDKTDAVTSTKYVDGVVKAEPLLEVPVKMSHKGLEKDVFITGLQLNNSLLKLLTDKQEVIEPPSKGLVISNLLAKKLDIKAGDMVTVKPFLGDKKEKLVPITKVISQYAGLGAYMNLNQLSGLLNEIPLASSVILTANDDSIPQIRKELQGAKNVTAVIDKNRAKLQLEKFAEGLMIWLYIMWFYAFVLGFAIVYNLNLISLSEREREMATLKVLGITDGEIARLFLYEQGILSIVGLILGLPMSYGLSLMINKALANEIYSPIFIIQPGSYIAGLVGTLVFLFSAQWKMKGKVGNLSGLDVLKQQG